MPETLGVPWKSAIKAIKRTLFTVALSVSQVRSREGMVCESLGSTLSSEDATHVIEIVVTISTYLPSRLSKYDRRLT
jgi:hypothetical protein